MVEVLHIERPVARKEHLCDSCGRTIRQGETYERQDNVYEGQRFTYKACEQCDVARAWAYRHARELGWYFEDEGLDLREYLNNYRTDRLSIFRLDFWFRRRWARKDGALIDVRALVELADRNPQGSGSSS